MTCLEPHRPFHVHVPGAGSKGLDLVSRKARATLDTMIVRDRLAGHHDGLFHFLWPRSAVP